MHRQPLYYISAIVLYTAPISTAPISTTNRGRVQNYGNNAVKSLQHGFHDSINSIWINPDIPYQNG